MGWDLTQPQSDFFWLDCKYPAFVGGFGCMRADTRIWTENGLKNICDILPGERVLSYDQNSSRYVLSPTSGAFPKGRDYLYQVQSQHGEFVSSGHHRCISLNGKYRPVSELGSSSVLCRLNKYLLKTISGSDLKSLIEDEGHYSQKDVDFLVNYGESARQYGQRFLQEEEAAEGHPPLSNGAPVLFRDSYLANIDRWDDREEYSQAHTRQHQLSDHVCTHDFLFLVALLFFFGGGQGLTLPVEYIQVSLPLVLLFLLMIGFRRIKELFSLSFSSLECVCNWCFFDIQILKYLHTFYKFPKYSPGSILSFRKSLYGSKYHRKELSSSLYPFSYTSPVNNLSSTDIIRVSRKEVKEVYWDLQVLNTNNYIDEYGHVHHNSGKTQTLLARAIRDKFMWPRSIVAIYEPTYDLARLILIPRLLELLDTAGVQYLHNKSENVIYLLNRGMFIIRTLDKPNRIIGYEAFRSHVDEIDTLKFKNAQNAWNKIIARNRQKLPGNPTNQVCAYTTPEGFNFVYNRWEKNPSKNHKYIVAPTYSNPYLPDDYVDSLKDQYDENLLNAYVEGLFTNLTSGTVYHKFSRVHNHSDVRIDLSQKEPLHIGMDFNVGRGCAVVHVLRDGLPIAVDEVVNSYDTPDTIRVLNSRYRGWPITVYPDASSKNRKSQNASETDLQLLKDERWRVKKINRNPGIKDRVASMNGMFCNAKGERRYKVNTVECPFYTNSLEQQAYDANGLPEKGEGKGDDINESGGYYIHNKFPIKKRRLEQTRLSGL